MSDPVLGVLMAGAVAAGAVRLAWGAWKLLWRSLSGDAAADTDLDEAVMSGAGRVNCGGYHQFEDLQMPSSGKRGEPHASPDTSATGRVKSDRAACGGYMQSEDFVQGPSSGKRGEPHASPDTSATGRVKSDRAACGGYVQSEDFVQGPSSGKRGKPHASPCPSAYSESKPHHTSTTCPHCRCRSLSDMVEALVCSLFHPPVLSPPNGEPSVAGVAKPRSRRKAIKILSYNVWHREDVDVTGRMKAIGNLIEKHSPQLICFQEVTPNIYKIFRSCKWAKAYGCSVSTKEATGRGSFSMQMSKLPAKFDSKNLIVFNMERELCLATVNFGMKRKLVFATSHLVSPKPDQNLMYSTERVAQAKKALGRLRNYSNVVFGGDMNWNEETDGSFPLPHGWVDAWEVLRPGEDGWTFDTKANKMLRGRQLLQKRLDRFFCCLKDFSMGHIEMIGREAIPELSSRKKKVLPSDHFGLLLTIYRL